MSLMLTGQRAWTPVQLLRACEALKISEWVLARKLGIVRADPSDWVDRALRISRPNRIEDYVKESEEGTIGPHRIQSVLKALNEHGYAAEEHQDVKPVERGRNHRVNYHTYVRVPLATGQDLESMSLADRAAVRTKVEKAVRKCAAYCHWETSRQLLRPLGWEHEFVLIVEDEFANKGINLTRLAASNLGDVGPVVLAGVYYSGAKDIVVLLHNWTGLGAFDVSRYVAEMTTDVHALRTDEFVQETIFVNVVTNHECARLVVTVDDAAALAHGMAALKRGWHRVRRGTALVLRLEPDLMQYAAYHIARTQVEEQSLTPEGSRLPTPAEAAVVQKRLLGIQNELLKHVPDAFARSKILNVGLHPEIARRGDAFADEPDLMFDQYWETSREALLALEESARR